MLRPYFWLFNSYKAYLLSCRTGVTHLPTFKLYWFEELLQIRHYSSTLTLVRTYICYLFVSILCEYLLTYYTIWTWTNMDVNHSVTGHIVSVWFYFLFAPCCLDSHQSEPASEMSRRKHKQPELTIHKSSSLCVISPKPPYPQMSSYISFSYILAPVAMSTRHSCTVSL